MHLTKGPHSFQTSQVLERYLFTYKLINDFFQKYLILFKIDEAISSFAGNMNIIFINCD